MSDKPLDEGWVLITAIVAVIMLGLILLKGCESNNKSFVERAFIDKGYDKNADGSWTKP